MKKERRYEASADNGRDFIYFEFYSVHRANSKSNLEDARREYKRLHGHTVKVLASWLIL